VAVTLAAQKRFKLMILPSPFYSASNNLTVADDSDYNAQTLQTIKLNRVILPAGVECLKFFLSWVRGFNMKRDPKVQRKAGPADSKPDDKLAAMIYKEIPVGIAESSIRGKYIDVNEEFCRIVGYEKEQLLGLGIQDIIFEEDYPMVSMLYEQLAEGKIPSYTLEKRYVRKDGMVVWVEAKRSLVRNSQGRPLYTVGAVLDVTERKRNEERHLEELENLVQQRTATLQELIQSLQTEIAERTQAEELLKSWAHIFENADWGIATVLQDRFVMVNPTFAKMHGYEVGELIGHSIYDVLAPESHTDTREQICIAYETGHNVYENKHIRKDGSLFPALVDTSVVKDKTGNVLYRAISIQNITERKQAQEALEDSHQHLQELSRRLVEVQEDERRAIARELHDRVGQNLSALNLNLSMMKERFSQARTEQIDARLIDSLKLVAETTRLVRDLLNELRPAALDAYGLKAALQEYIDQFALRYNIKVMLDVTNGSFPRLNPSLEITLLRIAQESLTNVARHARADQATLSLRLENDTVYLTVLDNGIGMNASQGETPHISHGLKIMRERAQAFGGTVNIGPSEEKGTKVEVVIPTGGILRKNAHIALF
jgi:PAS domain S-box-containing protein